MMRLIYEGSVKRLLERADRSDRLFFQFTDDYSVFDWGKMPDTIKDKGCSLALIGAFFFEKLSSPDFFKTLVQSPHLKNFDSIFLTNLFNSPTYKKLESDGLSSHYIGLHTGEKPLMLDDLDGSPGADKLFLEVQKASVFAPERRIFEVNQVYFYPENLESPLNRRLIPLEVVFRFGIPQGSSLKNRLEKDPLYYRKIGLETEPQENQLFDRPVVEFFTKLEPEDRHLSYQEAALISRLSPAEFEELLDKTRALALALYHVFAEIDITLFDGKFEFVLDNTDATADGARVVLADSIGPDELRLIYKNHHLSKELLRQYYQKSAWAEAVKQAKLRAKEDPSIDFKERCINELGHSPKPIGIDEKQVIDKLYPVLANTITGRILFENAGSLEELADSFDQIFSKTSAGI